MAKLSRPYDDIQNRYVKKMLDDLKLEQEALRTEMGLGDPTDKMPTTGGSGQFGPAEFKYGGKKKKYANGGYNAVTGEWEPEQPYSGPWSPELLNSVNSGDFSANDAATARAQSRNALFGNHTSTFNIAPKTNIPISGSYDITDVNTELSAPYTLPAKGTLDDSGVGTKPMNKKFDWGEAGVLGAQIVGLGYSLKRPNYAKYQRISPSLVNYNQAATDITNQSGLMEQSAAQAGKNQGQSSGAYLNWRTNLAARLGQQTGAQLAELRMNEVNTNVGIKNEALTRNAEIQRAETETNAREKDARMQALVGHLGGLGSKVAGYSKDKQAMKLDKAQFDTMMRLYPSLFRASDIVQNTDGTYTVKAK